MNRKKMNCVLKHFFIALVIFSLIIPLELSAKKQKKGADLIILKENGQVVEGELLYVRDSSLLLITSGNNTEAIVEISDVQEMRMKRKRNFWKGFLKTGWKGLAGGIVLGLCCCSHEPEGLRYKGCVMASGIMVGLYGALGGGLAAVLRGKYKSVPVISKSSTEIEDLLNQLREMARFKD